MARTVCVRLAEPPSTNLSITIPGAGTVEALGSFSLQGYNACMEARAFLGQINPIFAALGMPLCLLGCISSIMSIFDIGSFPPIDVGAIPRMIQQCKCLLSFTPIGFCGMITGLIRAVVAVLDCLLNLLGDLVQMSARIADLAASGASVVDIECLEAQVGTLQKSVMQGFGPVVKLWDSVGFLFEFVGIPFQSLSDIGSTGGLPEALAVVSDIKNVLNDISKVAASICP